MTDDKKNKDKKNNNDSSESTNEDCPAELKSKLKNTLTNKIINLQKKNAISIFEDDFAISNKINKILEHDIYNSNIKSKIFDINLNDNITVNDNLLIKIKDNDSTIWKADDFLLKAAQSFEDNTFKLKKERVELLDKLHKTELEMATHIRDKEKLAAAKKEADVNLSKLEDVNNDIKKQLALGNLIAQVNDSARKELFQNEDFRTLFENVTECKAYVVSIDIRRSTELMLKAKHRDYLKNLLSLFAKVCQR